MKPVLSAFLLLVAANASAADVAASAALEARAATEYAQCQVMGHAPLPPPTPLTEEYAAQAKQHAQQVTRICTQAMRDLLLSVGIDPTRADVEAAIIEQMGQVAQ